MTKVWSLSSLKVIAGLHSETGQLIVPVDMRESDENGSKSQPWRQRRPKPRRV